MSKTYNMTGWRMGWAAGNAELIGALQTVKTFVDTGQFLGVQAAAVAALDDADGWVPGNVEVFRKRRDALAGSLIEAGFEVQVPKATMYLWVPVPPGAGSSEAFAAARIGGAGRHRAPRRDARTGWGGLLPGRPDLARSPARRSGPPARGGALRLALVPKGSRNRALRAG